MVNVAFRPENNSQNNQESTVPRSDQATGSQGQVVENPPPITREDLPALEFGRPQSEVKFTRYRNFSFTSAIFVFLFLFWICRNSTKKLTKPYSVNVVLILHSFSNFFFFQFSGVSLNENDNDLETIEDIVEETIANEIAENERNNRRRNLLRTLRNGFFRLGIRR